MTGPTTRGDQPATETALTNAVLDFRPSRHGLHFANRFPPGPTVRIGPFDPRRIGIGDASAGLCGGMSFTVRDLFDARIEPPPDREPPANGSPQFRSLVRRQVQSLDWLRLPIRFWMLSALHTEPRGRIARLLRRRPLGELVRDREWPAIRAEIDAGRLAQVGLVRAAGSDPRVLTTNHQVLAWGYRAEAGSVVLRVYEPNWPDRDDVELRMRLAGNTPTFEQSTGEPLLGFFLTRFRPATARAWRRPS